HDLALLAAFTLAPYTTLFRSVLRHARASEFKVLLVFDSSEIRLELRDNGCGFDLQRRHEGFGLQGMSERAEGMGGRLTIQSAAEIGRDTSELQSRSDLVCRLL